MGDLQSPFPPSFRILYKVDDRVSGGGCHADVYLPDETISKGSKVPVAVMIHGGAFSLGASDGIPYNQARYLLSKGFALVSPDYRFLPHVTHKEIREDLIDVYKWIQNDLNQRLKELGSKASVDGTRACVMGWSAGGTSTVWLASDVQRYNDTNTPKLPPLKACIPTYPLVEGSGGMAQSRKAFDERLSTDSDLKRHWDSLLSEKVSSGFIPPIPPPKPAAVAGEDVEAMDLFNLPPVPHLPSRLAFVQAAFATGSINTFLVGSDPPYPTDIFPIDIVQSDFPPTMIVVATADTLIPTSHSYNLHSKLKDLGVETALVECPGMKHGEAECLPGLVFWKDDCTWWEDAIRPSLDWAIKRVLA